MIFENRQEAGWLLGEKLKEEKIVDPIVFGLARGGIVTASAVAKTLGAKLDVVVVRKLASPFNPEFGFGALAPLHTKVIDDDTVLMLGLTGDELNDIIDAETEELERRLRAYRHSSTYPDLSNRTVILVDDGIATGVSMKAALIFMKRLNATDIIVAVPVCATSSLVGLKGYNLRVICLESPEYFMAVGEFYHQFDQVSDEEVTKTLKEFK